MFFRYFNVERDPVQPIETPLFNGREYNCGLWTVRVSIVVGLTTTFLLNRRAYVAK